MRTAPYVLALALAFAAPAGATGCPLVTDPAGDSRAAFLVVGSSNTDIRSADVASGATTVVAVVRVTSLLPDPASLGGASWLVGWRVDGVLHTLGLHRDASGTYYSGKNRGVTTGTPLSYTVDANAGVVTMSVPRSGVPALATPGKTFTGIFATTTAKTGAGTSAADSASAAPGVTYADGSPGCVPAS